MRIRSAGSASEVLSARRRGDAVGNTALHHIVDKGFDRAEELLAVIGANVNATNSRGQTPLAIVARARSGNREAAPATVELLRVLGAR